MARETVTVHRPGRRRAAAQIAVQPATATATDDQ
jgi:hypothetical protein